MLGPSADNSLRNLYSRSINKYSARVVYFYAVYIS